MKALFLSLLATTLFAGCDSSTYWAGMTVYDHFPLDGSVRSWEYTSFEEGFPYQILVEKTSTAQVGDYEVVTLAHNDKNTGDLLLEMKWSSDVSDGVLIHGYQDYMNGGEAVTFDTPVEFLPKTMETGESIETESNGFTFTSTFVEIVGCETVWAPDWGTKDCVHMNLDDGDGDDTTNAALTGDYWLVSRWGPAWFEVPFYGTRWDLTLATWQE